MVCSEKQKRKLGGKKGKGDKEKEEEGEKLWLVYFTIFTWFLVAISIHTSAPRG